MIESKINILVTGIGGDIGLGIVNILNEIKYHNRLIGCDIDNYPATKYDVDDFIIAPRATDEEKYHKFILEVIDKYNVDLIIPSSEIEIKYFVKNKVYFDENGIKLMVNNKFIVETFMDKYETIDFFKSNDMKFPYTVKINEFNGEIDYPCILKLPVSAGSKGVFEVDSEEDLQYFRKKYPQAMIQEQIGDKSQEYTIAIFSDGESVYNIAFRRYLGFGSMSRFVELVSDDKIDILAKKIAVLVNLYGSINVQVRKDVKGDYIPFEINPRLSSTLAFRNHFGFSDLKWWIDILYGLKVEYKKIYTSGIGVKALREVYFDLR